MQEVLQVLRRRWLVVVPLLLLTLVGAGAVFLVTPKQYESVSSLVVLTPPEVAGSEIEGPVNPFLNFGGSQVTAAEVLAVRMGDSAVLELLEDAGVDSEWTFEVQTDTGPLAVVTVQGDSVEEVEKATEEIVSQAQVQFAAIQLDAGSPEDQLVRIEFVSSPAEPDSLVGNRLRNALVVTALGVGVTVLLAFSIEGISRSLARRREKAGETETDEPETDESGADQPEASDTETAQPQADEPRADETSRQSENARV